MGYRDDFYMVKYIIGYTGDLHDFPTVYFQKGDEYGHVTQKHDYPQNVGRMEVRQSNTHSIGNEIHEGTLKLVERDKGKITHVSRSTLTRVNVLDPSATDTVALLAQSICIAGAGEKYITTYSREDFKKIDSTMHAKSQLNDELRPPLPARPSQEKIAKFTPPELPARPSNEKIERSMERRRT
jgi:hypothetical protein